MPNVLAAQQRSPLARPDNRGREPPGFQPAIELLVPLVDEATRFMVTDAFITRWGATMASGERRLAVLDLAISHDWLQRDADHPPHGAPELAQELVQSDVALGALRALESF